LLRFPQPRLPAGSGSLSEGGADAILEDAVAPVPDVELPPVNLRFLLTPDHDPALDYLDQLAGFDIMDDTEREARIAVARHTGS
jgi:hypothetical protein